RRVGRSDLDLGTSDARAAAGAGDLAGQRSDRAVRAARELERADDRVEVEGAGRRVKLIRIPERAVVCLIDAQRRVVTPAAEAAGLGAATREHRGFGLG